MLPRCGAALKHRISDNPESDGYYAVVSRRGDAVDGMMVYRYAQQSGLKLLFVADLVALSDAARRALWRRAVECAAERDQDLVAIWYPRRPDAVGSMAPWLPVPVERKHVIFYENDLGRCILGDKGRWLFSIIDSDNI